MATYEDFVAVGCKLIKTSPVARELIIATHGQLCDGCCYSQDRTCGKRPVQNQSRATPAVAARPVHVETVREEAARRAISISQVRKERAEHAS